MNDLDLNLLRTFDALLQTQSVTRAATQLGMTASGVSRALGRLRTHFEDDLLVREGRGMRATPRALELAPMVARVLDDVARLRQAGRFDPSTDAWTARISGSDYVEHVFLPPLAAQLAQDAPHVRLFSRRGRRVDTDLEEARVDFAVGIRGTFDAPDLQVARLCEDGLVAVLREGHPCADALTLDAYCSLRHVLVAPGGDDGGILDTMLAAQGRTRTVAVVTSTFAAALPLVAHSNDIVAFPVGLARALIDRWPLTMRPLPLPVRPFVLDLFWPARLHTNPAHRYVRERMLAIGQGHRNAASAER